MSSEDRAISGEKGGMQSVHTVKSLTRIVGYALNSEDKKVPDTG